MKIGLFDSGLGGLTILRAVAKELPAHDFYYYGDTVNLPYGDKTETDIYVFSVAAMDYLFSHGCTLVVIACNTASSETLRRLQDEYLPAHYPERRILGVIVPTIETLVADGVKEPLLLATKRTVESGKYERELLKCATEVVLHSAATPVLVPLIEAGEIDEATAAAIAVANNLRNDYPDIDAVILGCTHYTELKEGLRAHYGVALRIYSQDEIIPKKLADYIARHQELETGDSSGVRSIHLTAHRPDYDKVIAQLLGGVFVSEE